MAVRSFYYHICVENRRGYGILGYLNNIGINRVFEDEILKIYFKFANRLVQLINTHACVENL